MFYSCAFARFCFYFYRVTLYDTYLYDVAAMIYVMGALNKHLYLYLYLTHGTPLASVTRGGPPVYGHSTTLSRDSAVASCRTGVAGGSGDETTGPGPPGLRTVLLPSPRAGRCQRRSEHFS